MNLYDVEGKMVVITCKDGETLIGMAQYYTPAYDDPDNRTNICVGNILVYEDERESIEIV